MSRYARAVPRGANGPMLYALTQMDNPLARYRRRTPQELAFPIPAKRVRRAHPGETSRPANAGPIGVGGQDRVPGGRLRRSLAGWLASRPRWRPRCSRLSDRTAELYRWLGGTDRPLVSHRRGRSPRPACDRTARRPDRQPRHARLRPPLPPRSLLRAVQAADSYPVRTARTRSMRARGIGKPAVAAHLNAW